MCLRNFWHDLSTALMARTLKGFNDFSVKVHNVKIHLNKRKKHAKESGMTTHVIAVAVVPKGGATFVLR